MRTRPERVALAALVALLSPSPARTQQQPSPIVFLERAYFALGTPSGRNLLFEGQPTAHFFIANGFGDPLWQQKGGFAWAMPISEMFVVRMTNTASSPVLTPSYHIGPRFQGIWLHRRGDSTSFWMLHGLSGLVHYSNGQRGCTYLGFVRNAVTGDCDVVNAGLAAQRVANVEDGDFSTSYAPLRINFRYGSLINPFDWLKWQATIGAEVQWHPYDWFVPGAPNREQAIEYGQHQWSAFAEWECRLGRRGGVVRLAGDYTQRFGGGRSPFDGGGAEASYVLDELDVPRIRMHLQRVGLFARFYSGYDYYNIRFQDRRSFWAAGLVFDPDRLDALEGSFSDDGRPRTEAKDGCVKFWERETRRVR